MSLSYKHSYKQRRHMRNIVVFILIAIVFIVASFIVMYIRSLDLNSIGKQAFILDRAQMEPLKLQHFKQVLANRDDDSFRNPENIDIVQGENRYDNSVYMPYNGAVTNDYFSDALFIGNSRTQGFVMYNALPGAESFCSQGLNLESVYQERVANGTTILKALEQKQYSKIYLMFGINELGWAFDDVFEERYAAFVDEIAKLQPNAIIYVQSILPVSAKKSEQDRIFTNDNVNHFNNMIKHFCGQRSNVIYLDVAKAVMDENGVLPEDASPDGVHCNREYCKKWLDYLKANTFVRIGAEDATEAGTSEEDTTKADTTEDTSATDTTQE